MSDNDNRRPYNQEELAQLASAMMEATKAVKANQIRGSSYYPYYKEQYALEVKELLDLVVSTGQPRIIPEQDLTASTLKNKFYQALSYLKEVLDPDDRYKEIHARAVDITPIPRKGIIVRPKKEKGSLTGFIHDTSWRQRLQEFIDTSTPKQKLELIGIPMTPEDIEWINEQLKGIEHLFYSEINLTAVVLVRWDK